MSTLRWLGKALPIADVWTITLGGTWIAGETLTVTINGKDLVLTIGTTVTTSQIAAELETAWNEDSDTALGTGYSVNERGINIPEFAEATASNSSSTVVLTGVTKGKPFTPTVSEASASGTISVSNTIPATGPNYWDNTDNWDSGSLPVDNDDVIIDYTNVPIKYALAQSAIELTSLTIGPGLGTDFRIGLEKVNTDGDEYIEYRTDYLTIGAATCVINGDVNLCKINFEAEQLTMHAYQTGSGLDENTPALIFKGTHASNVVNIRGESSVGVALYGGETAVIATLKIDGQADVRLGAGVTLTTVTINNGTVETNSAITTLNVGTEEDAPTVTIQAGAVTTLNLNNGTVFYNGTGTLDTALVAGGGVLDFSLDPRAKTVSNPIDIYGQSCQVRDPDKVVSSLIVDFNQGANQGQVVWGQNVRLTRGTPA